MISYTAILRELERELAESRALLSGVFADFSDKEIAKESKSVQRVWLAGEELATEREGRKA